MLERIQKGSSTYAVYDLKDKNTAIDEISVIIINNNQYRPIGLAPIRVESINGINNKLLFDVTGQVSLRDYISRNISQNDFKDMITSLIISIENFDEYMIDVHQVLLDIDSVYINELDHKISFICIAVKNTSQSGDLFTFFRTLVENSHVSVSSSEKDYFHCVWNVIRSGNGFSLSNMKTAMINGTTNIPIPSDNSTNSVSKQETAKDTAHSVQQSTPSENIVTVTPTSIESPVQQLPIQPMIEEKKKTGLFDKFFGSKKNNVKNNEIKPGNGGYHGGLASLKNKPMNKKMQQSQVSQVMNSSENMNYEQVDISKQNDAVNTMQQTHLYENRDFGGTTVLDGLTHIPVQSPINQPVSQPIQPVFNQPVSQPTQNAMNQCEKNSVSSGTEMFNYNMISKQESENNIPKMASQSLNLKKPSQVNSVMGGFGETTVLNSDSGDTTVLSDIESPALSAYLIRFKNSEKINISKSVFYIGKERSTVDYFIGDNAAISRRHANIIRKNNDYFIVDTNSTNHTYINGQKIPGNVEMKIENGDKIKLANENFEFKLF